MHMRLVVDGNPAEAVKRSKAKAKPVPKPKPENVTPRSHALVIAIVVNAQQYPTKSK